MNKVILIGNLGQDAELKGEGEKAFCSFSMATSESWKDASGQKQERTEWHSCTLWGKRATGLAKYLTKGIKIAVEGKIQTDNYTDKEGIEKRFTRIKVDSLEFVSKAENRSPAHTNGGPANYPQAPGSSNEPSGRDFSSANEDDLPF